MTTINEVIKESWGVPIIDFDAYNLPSFPDDIFPDWLRQFILNVADVSQTPIDASAISAFSVLSAAVAKKFVIKPFSKGSWTEQNNLFTVVAMKSGERKSTVHGYFVKPIIDFEITKQMEFKEGKISATHPPRYVSDDVTSEKLIILLKQNDERMAILSSEGGLFETLNGRYSNIPNLDVFLKGYTGDYIVVDRVNRASETLYKPILTIGLFVQPTTLQGLPTRMIDRGLFGRFLFSFPESLGGGRDVTPKEIDVQIQQTYLNNITALLLLEREQPITLTLNDDAQYQFLGFQMEHEKQLHNNPSLEFFRSWIERLPGHLLRIASLIHVAEQLNNGIPAIESLDTCVSSLTMEKIINSAHYFVEHAMAAFGCMKSDEDLESAKYLWSVLYRDNKEEYKKQDVWKMTKGKFTKAEYLDNALIILIDRGYIRPKGLSDNMLIKGRRGLVIEINPAYKTVKKEASLKLTHLIIDKIPAPKEVVVGGVK